jgi:energy-coupling factor transporter ATP-binding protein EcfA2
MLKRIKIQSYRSCFNTTFECHPNLSVLIGPNGSGKTNILQAIMLLNRMMHQDTWRYLQTPAGGLASQLDFDFNVGRARAHLSTLVSTQTDDSNKDEVTRSRQRWTYFSRNITFKTDNSLPLISGDSFITYSTAPIYQRGRMILRSRSLLNKQPKWSRDAQLEIAYFCSKIRYYGASQFTNPGACPISFEIEREGKERKASRLTGHAKLLYDIYSASRSTDTEKFSRFFEIVGPNGLKLVDKISFKEVQTSSVNFTVKVGGRVEKRRRRQLLIIPQFRIGRQLLSPNQLSEGTFKTIALLFYVVTDESSALLIEEPEVCIHHGLLSSVLSVITDLCITD